MSSRRASTPKEEFLNLFEDACDESLDDQAKAKLEWLYQVTIQHALDNGKTWNDEARIYVLPKLAELASRVESFPGPIVTGPALAHAADWVIKKYRKKYRDNGFLLAWCDGYPE